MHNIYSLGSDTCYHLGDSSESSHTHVPVAHYSYLSDTVRSSLTPVPQVTVKVPSQSCEIHHGLHSLSNWSNVRIRFSGYVKVFLIELMKCMYTRFYQADMFRFMVNSQKRDLNAIRRVRTRIWIKITMIILNFLKYDVQLTKYYCSLCFWLQVYRWMCIN